MNQLLASWQAPEHNESNFTEKVKTGLVVFASILFAIALLTRNFLFAVFVAIASIVVYMYSRRKPKIIDIKISNTSIKSGVMEYTFDDLQSFWIFYDPPTLSKISIIAKKKLSQYINIPLGDENPEEISEILEQYIPKKKQEESFIDSVARKLGF